MSNKWPVTRLKRISISPNTHPYNVTPTNRSEELIKVTNPELFQFEGLSIGDEDGQAFIIPLDESSKEVAEYIIRAVRAYEGE